MPERLSRPVSGSVTSCSFMCDTSAPKDASRPTQMAEIRAHGTIRSGM